MTKKIIKHEINQEEVLIYNLSDIHYGNTACMRKAFEQIVNEIQHIDNAYWVSTGNILDCNISKGKHYNPCSMDINDEMDAIRRILTPIAHKCLGVCGSDHSDKIKRLADIDIEQALWRPMGIPYYKDIALINIRFGNAGWRSKFIVMHHGDAKSTSIAAVTESLDRLQATIPCADVYLEGHAHKYISYYRNSNIINHVIGTIEEQTSLLCGGGHMLDWATSYAPKEKYIPYPCGVPIISLCVYDRSAQVTFKECHVDTISKLRIN